MASTPLSKELKDEITKKCVEQVAVSLKSRVARFNEIQKHEDVYLGVKTPALRGRNNIPFDAVTVRGFVDTLLSKVDEGLQISYERAPGRRQDKRAAEALTAAVDQIRGPDAGAWDIKDLGGKKLGIFAGRAIYKKYSERENGKFEDCFENVDHWDFLTDPKGGGFLDKHRFKGQINIFRSADDLKECADEGEFDARQVAKLLNKQTPEQDTQNQTDHEHQQQRSAAMGIDSNVQMDSGRQFRLVEWVMVHKGQWYYVVFSREHNLWLRVEPLEDVFTVAKHYPGRGPWVSWATHFDPFVFWTISPMDSIRPIAAAIKKTLNLSLDNLEKRNWGQRAYDPNVFNPRELSWKHDGLVKANVRVNQNINNHIVTFETPDTTAITINLVDWMNAYLGEQTGITPASKGKSEDSKVGIYVGNLQQVADRLGLTNKMYEQCHVDLAVNAQWGLFDYMPEEYAVKIIGNDGVEWNEILKREDVNRRFTIRVRGSDFEQKMNEAMAVRKENALKTLAISPQLMQRVNPGWYLREVLSLGGFEQEDIRNALDTANEADEDVLSRAAQAIEDIITGKKPQTYRGATTGYVRYILDFAQDTELEKGQFDKLVAFAKQHIPIAQQNMDRRVLQLKISSAVSQAMGGQPTGAGAGNTPTPTGTPIPSPAALPSPGTPQAGAGASITPNVG